jgi:hypothetical protein
LFCGKPAPHRFVRFCADPAYQWEAPVYEDRDVRDWKQNTWLFVPTLKLPEEIADLPKPNLLIAAVYKDGTPFLYRLPLTGSTEAESGLELVPRLIAGWHRIVRVDREYKAIPPKTQIPDPVWPKALMEAWVKAAFGKRIVASNAHPKVLELLG